MGEQVWTYLHSHSVPYNPLHDRGYASIGDVMNTRPLEAGESERSGRFMYSGTNVTECGMHQHQARIEAMQRAAKTKRQQLQIPPLPCGFCLELVPDRFEALV